VHTVFVSTNLLLSAVGDYGFIMLNNHQSGGLQNWFPQSVVLG